MADSQHPTKEQIETRIWKEIEQYKQRLGWCTTIGSARAWWNSFERKNIRRPRLVLKLVKELAARDATLFEFFLVYVYSDSEDVQCNLDFFDLVRARTPSKRRITYFDVTSAPCGLFIEGERQYRRAIPTFALSEWERSLTEQMRDELGAQRGNLSESDLREMLGHMEVLVGIGEAPIGAIEQWKDLCQARKSRKYLIAQIVLLREMYARGISLLELYYAYEHTELNRFEEVFDHINALHHLQEVPELSASDFYDENGRPYELGIGRIN